MSEDHAVSHQKPLRTGAALGPMSLYQLGSRVRNFFPVFVALDQDQFHSHKIPLSSMFTYLDS